MKNINIYLLLSAFMLLVVSSCTDLEPIVYSNPVLVEGGGYTKEDADRFLNAAYRSFADLSSQDRVYAMQEQTSDEMLAPTRGSDWDDGGKWRQLNFHTWDPINVEITNAWNLLGGASFSSTQAIVANEQVGNDQQAAEAKVLYAWATLMQLDLWGQVPFRQIDLPTEEQPLSPPVYSRTGAFDVAVSNLEEALPDLVESSPEKDLGVATKDVCRVILARALLNKHIYTGATSPSATDMNRVANLCGEVIASGRYALLDNYFDNFYWDNHKSKGIIFHMVSVSGARIGNVRSRWRMGTHYNQATSGWNGFTTLADFYDKFADDDSRKGGEYPGFTDLTGIRTGFLIGQQVNGDGEDVETRQNAPLIFTRDFPSGPTQANEAQGIRVIKYIPNITLFAGKPDNDNELTFNDYAYIRLGEVYLMYAEALLRGGSASGSNNIGTAADAYNTLRDARIENNTDAASVSLDDILDERGRELYFEGIRRTDLIRFGQFLQPNEIRTTQSTEDKLLFPIPARALSSNQNLSQNPGY